MLYAGLLPTGRLGAILDCGITAFKPDSTPPFFLPLVLGSLGSCPGAGGCPVGLAGGADMATPGLSTQNGGGRCEGGGK